MHGFNDSNGARFLRRGLDTFNDFAGNGFLDSLTRNCKRGHILEATSRGQCCKVATGPHGRYMGPHFRVHSMGSKHYFLTTSSLRGRQPSLHLPIRGNRLQPLLLLEAAAAEAAKWFCTALKMLEVFPLEFG